MKLVPIFVFCLFALTPLAHSVTQAQVFSTAAGPVTITPLNHASTLIEAGGKVIYLDPAKPVNWPGRPKADLILITDIHGDHMDPDSIKEISKPGTEIMAPPAVVQNRDHRQAHCQWRDQDLGRWTIEAIPAYNLKRGPSPGKFFHDKGRGNGYVLTYGGKRFYFSGDTEGVPEMRALKNIDVAFVCMNLPYTMPPDEAADAVKAFHPKIVSHITTAVPISQFFKRDWKAQALKCDCSSGIRNSAPNRVRAGVLICPAEQSSAFLSQYPSTSRAMLDRADEDIYPCATGGPGGFRGYRLWKAGGESNAVSCMPELLNRPSRSVQQPKWLTQSGIQRMDCARICSPLHQTSSPRYTRGKSVIPLTGGQFDSKILTVRQVCTSECRVPASGP